MQRQWHVMKTSLLIRVISFVIVGIFVLNLAVLLVYFPISSSLSSSELSPLSLKIKNHEPFGNLREKNLRKKDMQLQQRALINKAHVEQQQQQSARKERSKETPMDLAETDANTTARCPVYGCPVYPPELTAMQTNETIRKALEFSGYLVAPSTSKVIQTSSEFRFASESFATLSQQGKSHTINQDRAVFVSPFLPDLLSLTSTTTTKKSFLACIFDGHGQLGHKVAQEVVEKFPIILSEKLILALSGDVKNAIDSNQRNKNSSPDKISGGNTDKAIVGRTEDYDSTDVAIRKALNETFLEVNDKGTRSTFLLGGCTASVSLRWGSKLYVANTGDSETIVVSASPHSKQQQQQQQQQQHNSMITNVEYGTRRDKANQPGERARIEKLGGKIHINAQGFDPRVIVHSKAANDTIALAMSRSIGDLEWKAVGVTAEPTIDLIDLSKAPLSDSDKTVFLLAASDGFWDLRQKHFYADQLATSFRNRHHNIRDKKGEGNAGAKFQSLFHLYDVIQRITPKVQKGYRDDITATIVNLE